MYIYYQSEFKVIKKKKKGGLPIVPKKNGYFKFKNILGGIEK